MHELNEYGRFTDTATIAKRAAMDKARRDQREAEYQAQQKAAAAAQAKKAETDIVMAGRANALPSNVIAILQKEPSKCASVGVSKDLAQWIFNTHADRVQAAVVERDRAFAERVKAGQL